MNDEVPKPERLDWSDAESALRSLGQFVDASFYSKDRSGLERALRVADGLDSSGWSRAQQGHLFYVKANINADLFSGNHATSGTIPWEDNNLEGQVLSLRRAILSAESGKDSPPWLMQALTNLGNVLNHVGRPVEAVETWNHALAIDPTFPMAKGNRGLGFIAYAMALYDDGHRHILFAAAHRDLEEAIRHQNRLEKDAIDGFPKTLADLRRALGTDPSKFLDVPPFSLGQSAEEQRYRKWCLDRQLFLNPLNDVGDWSAAATDVLGLPTLTSDDYQPGEWVAVFNQIKQEYASARYLLFEGMTCTKPHFSDKKVLLMNTLDYPVYSLASEKVKAAYRMSYSLFDRLALLLNDYLDLGFSENKIGFKSIWHDRGERKRGIHSKLKDRPNWPLRGLYWLSKDLFERKEGFRESLLPDAREIADVRHQIEHKMLRLHQFGASISARDTLFPKRRRIGHSLDYELFEAKAFRLLKMTRAAIIYTTLAIGQEEQIQDGARDPSKFVMPVATDVWEDDWKAPHT